MNPNEIHSSEADEQVAYFTFGFGHVHAVNGFTYDKDVVVKIKAPDPRQIMFNTFGRMWAMQYNEEEVTPEFMLYFPRGIKELK